MCRQGDRVCDIERSEPLHLSNFEIIVYGTGNEHARKVKGCGMLMIGGGDTQNHCRHQISVPLVPLPEMPEAGNEDVGSDGEVNKF